jgi:hypothetical protein
MAELFSSSGYDRDRGIADNPDVSNLLQKIGCNEGGRPRRKGAAW